MNATWSIQFAAQCHSIEDEGFSCMVCGADATGHAVVNGGPHDGRCLAVLCRRHASDVGWAEFRERLVEWGTANLLSLDGGPGDDGSPEVWHRDHLDPLPNDEHGTGW